jgi:hypothetical protein
MRFVLQTIESILFSLFPRKKLEQLVIKQLDAHFCHSPYEYILTSSGRSALALLFERIKNDSEKKCHSVLLPDYICNVVHDAARYSGLKSLTYMTDENYKPVVSDMRDKMLGGGCCVLLASILGRINNNKKIVSEVRSVDPQCIIIYDECQNLMGARKIDLDRNSHIVLSFNNKMTPGLLGGVLVSMNSNDLIKIHVHNNMINWEYNVVMLLTYLKQNLKELYYAIRAKYPEPSAIEFSLCQGKYSVYPGPISRISLSAAYVALKNLSFHHEVLIKNNELAREWHKKGIISIQGEPETNDAPYIPIVNNNPKGRFPIKGRYGTQGEPPKDGTENCLILSNSFLYLLEM